MMKMALEERRRRKMKVKNKEDMIHTLEKEDKNQSLISTFLSGRTGADLRYQIFSREEEEEQEEEKGGRGHTIDSFDREDAWEDMNQEEEASAGKRAMTRSSPVKEQLT